MNRNISCFWVCVIAAILLVTGGVMVQDEAIASEITFAATGPATLTVSGEGIYLQIYFAQGETPWFSPFDEDGNPFPDGNYKYELIIQPVIDTAALQEAVAAGDNRTVEAIARMEQEQMEIITGSFKTVEGAIVLHGQLDQTEITVNP